MQFFGEPWDAPVCDPHDEASVPQAETPVGRACFAYHCGRLIAEGDQGFLIPYAGPEDAGLKPWHRRCFQLTIMPAPFWRDLP